MKSSILTPKPEPEKKFLTRLDPRVKLVSILIFVLMVIFTPSHHHLKFLVYFLMLSAMMGLSRVPLRDCAKRLLLVLPLLLFLASSVMIFNKDPAPEERQILWNLLVKSFLSFLAVADLSLTTQFYDLVKGLERMRIPRILTSILTFSYRYSLLLTREAQRLNRARQSRSYAQRTKREETRILSRLLPHLFFQTFVRSERIYAAMLSRGYGGKMQTLSDLKLGGEDILFAVVILSLLSLTWILL